MLETLEKAQTSFITATHLHKIADLPSVTKLEKVKPYHLKVSYDEENEKIIYERELTEGQGEKFYGLQVAKFLMNDKDFNKRTNEILGEFDNSGKKSRYNADLTLDECYFCQRTDNLECHHINWQKDFNKNNINAKSVKKEISDILESVYEKDYVKISEGSNVGGNLKKHLRALDKKMKVV